MSDKAVVILGFLGTQLDAGDGPGRWEKWRPTVSLGMHEDFLVHRMELLVDQRRYAALARQGKGGCRGFLSATASLRCSA